MRSARNPTNTIALRVQRLVRSSSTSGSDDALSRPGDPASSGLLAAVARSGSVATREDPRVRDARRLAFSPADAARALHLPGVCPRVAVRGVARPRVRGLCVLSAVLSHALLRPHAIPEYVDLLVPRSSSDLFAERTDRHDAVNERRAAYIVWVRSWRRSARDRALLLSSIASLGRRLCECRLGSPGLLPLPRCHGLALSHSRCSYARHASLARACISRGLPRANRFRASRTAEPYEDAPHLAKETWRRYSRVRRRPRRRAQKRPAARWRRGGERWSRVYAPRRHHRHRGARGKPAAPHSAPRPPRAIAVSSDRPSR